MFGNKLAKKRNLFNYNIDPYYIKEKLWTISIYRAFIRCLQKLGIMQVAKKLLLS